VSGSQEYMAMEKLYELYVDGGYDLLVLDTPPTRNALDFLDAPERLAHFFEGRALRALLRPTGAGVRLLGRGASMMLGLLGRITGADLLGDLSEFLRLLSGLVGGFRERATAVEALLRDPATTFLLVTSPEHEPIDEALAFRAHLEQAGMALGGAIVNRVNVDELGAREAGDVEPLLVSEAGLSAALARQVAAAFVDEHALVRRDAANVARLADALGDAIPLIEVPQLDEDVHDAAGLVALHAQLFEPR
jgi:anion-transporting  ArsA/GET3 family ATPase